MGTCVSSHRDPDSAMKVQLSFGSKADNLVIPSPTKDKDKPLIIDGDVVLKPQWPTTQSATSFRDFGSKEETFFDSQAWLESDCEDDFMSVNGEFTPSRGNTPVHHNFSVGTLRVNGGAPLSIPQPSPTPSEKKMKLADLFKQSIHNQEDEEEEKTNGKVETEANSVCSCELTPNGSLKPKRERLAISMQRCFPSLLSSCSSSTERKKKMSPTHPHAIAVGDK